MSETETDVQATQAPSTLLHPGLSPVEFEYALAQSSPNARLAFICRELYAVRQIVNSAVPQLEAMTRNPLLRGLFKGMGV